MKLLSLFCMLVVLAFLASPVFANPIPVVVYEASNGQNYALSPGVEDGSCSPVPGGMECSGSGGNSSSSSSATGCGTVSGQAFCVIVPFGWSPPEALPFATSTLECPNKGKQYELHVGGGSCTPNNNINMTCSDGGVNKAEATCEKGCGTVTGDGKCTPKKLAGS